MKVTAERPPAGQIQCQAALNGDHYVGRLVPPEGSQSLWLWACEHKHRGPFGKDRALDCASLHLRQIAAYS